VDLAAVDPRSNDGVSVVATLSAGVLFRNEFERSPGPTQPLMQISEVIVIARRLGKRPFGEHIESFMRSAALLLVEFSLRMVVANVAKSIRQFDKD
jgi:hypothetical protein